MRRSHLTTIFIALIALAATVATAQSVAIQPRFQSVGHFHNGLAPAQENDRWGLIDIRGRWAVSPRYDGILSGRNGRFGIRENGRWGFVDTSGEIIVQPTYDEARPFADGVAAVKNGGIWGFISTSGAIETPLEFSEIGRREGRLFPARKDDDPWRTMRAAVGLGAAPYKSTEWGNGAIFNVSLRQSNRRVQATRVYGFSEGATVAVFDEGEALMNALGRALSSDQNPFYKSIRRRSEGLAAATRNGETWGYIQENGNFWHNGAFTGAREFTQGVAPVRQNGKWGYLNKKGQLALKPRYDRAYSFHEGYAPMRNGEKRGFLKLENGQITEFVSPRYEDVFRFQEGLAPIKIGGLWGFLSNDEAGPAIRQREIVDLIPE